MQTINMVNSWQRRLEIENENRKNHRIPLERDASNDVSVFEDMTQLFFERMSVRKNLSRQDYLCCPEELRQKSQVH